MPVPIFARAWEMVTAPIYPIYPICRDAVKEIRRIVSLNAFEEYRKAHSGDQS